VIKSASLAVCTIGQALAQARELTTKHAIKQVDRLLSNSAIDAWEMFADWVPEVVGNAQDIAVVIDWTEFDADDQATLVASLVTSYRGGLVTSKAEAKAAEIKRLYARRWTVEPTFRDTKDLRFGMGLKSVRVSEPQRRDRMLLLSAFAITFLTLLGEAGDDLGMDRLLKSNTARKRLLDAANGFWVALRPGCTAGWSAS
jgi:hypothetical protein